MGLKEACTREARTSWRSKCLFTRLVWPSARRLYKTTGALS